MILRLHPCFTPRPISIAKKLVRMRANDGYGHGVFCTHVNLSLGYKFKAASCWSDDVLSTIFLKSLSTANLCNWWNSIFATPCPRCDDATLIRLNSASPRRPPVSGLNGELASLCEAVVYFPLCACSTETLPITPPSSTATQKQDLPPSAFK